MKAAILSGKGGTGRTTVATAFIKLAGVKAYADVACADPFAVSKLLRLRTTIIRLSTILVKAVEYVPPYVRKKQSLWNRMWQGS